MLSVQTVQDRRRVASQILKDPVMGVDYDGEMPSSSTSQIALADVYMKDLPAIFPRNRVSIFLNRLFFFVPVLSGETPNTDGSSFWRIGIASPSEGSSFPRHPDITWLQEALNPRCPWEIKPHILSVGAWSRYRVRAAVASTFFKKIGGGNVLLVGNAAHVHSPTKSQPGPLRRCRPRQRDPYTYRFHGLYETDAGLPLSVYAISRRKIALRIVGMTTGMTNLLNAGTGWKAWLHNLALWIGVFFPFVRKAAAWRLSGLLKRDS